MDIRATEQQYNPYRIFTREQWARLRDDTPMTLEPGEFERLRSMLLQSLAAAKEVEADLEPVSLAGSRATALALVFSELFQNALEHGGQWVRVELAQRDGDVVLAVADDGAGIDGAASGTGLSIVRALVRDELRGTLSLERNGSFRAEVVFPA